MFTVEPAPTVTFSMRRIPPTSLSTSFSQVMSALASMTRLLRFISLVQISRGPSPSGEGRSDMVWVMCVPSRFMTDSVPGQRSA